MLGKLLETFIDIQVGQNVYRGALADSVEALPVYNNDDLQNDLVMAYAQDENPTPRIKKEELRYVEEGNIVYALSIGKAAIASKFTEGKVLNPNFALIEIKNKKQLDPGYLCYILNEDKDIQRQKNEFAQGSILTRVTPKQLKQFEVTLPPIQEQKKIGAIYLKTKHYLYLHLQEQKTTNTFVMALLDRIKKGNKQ